MWPRVELPVLLVMLAVSVITIIFNP